MKTLYTLFTAIFLFSSFSSCKLAEDIDKLKKNPFDYSADVALPLLVGLVDAEDLFGVDIGKGEIFVDSAGVWTYRYDTTAFEQSFGNFLELPDIPVPMLDSIIDFDIQGSDLNQMFLSSGYVGYLIQLNPGDRYRIRLNLPDVAKNQVPFSQEFDVQGPGMQRDSFDLSGYLMDIRSGKLRVNYSARDLNSNQPALVPNFVVPFTGLEPFFATGDFGGEDSIVERGSVAFSLPFDSSDVAIYRITDPTLKLHITHSAGIPLTLSSDTMLITSEFGDETSILIPELENGTVLNYPSFDELGQSETTTFTFNEGNSSLGTALSNWPKSFDYRIEFNPGSPIAPDTASFLIDTTRIRARMEVIVPLFGAISLFRYADTADLDMSKMANLSALEFTMESQNGFPFEIEIQAYFLDADFQVLDSLFDDAARIIGPAPVDVNGVVTQPFDFIVEIPFNLEKIERIRNARNFTGNFLFTTTNANTEDVIFREEYKLDYKLRMAGTVVN